MADFSKIKLDSGVYNVKDATARSGVQSLKAVATTSTNGLMSSTDKSKLNGIGVMTGATSTAAGTSGLTPTPSAGSNTKYLRGDGTWASVIAASVNTSTNTLIIGS